MLLVLFVGDEVGDLGVAAALAPRGRNSGDKLGEVEVGPKPMDVAQGGIVGGRGILDGG